MQAPKSDILAKVRQALVTDAAGHRLLLAVSGGADSVAMLDMVAQLAPDMDCELVVGHVDHGLRAESQADAEFVSSLARRLGLSALRRQVDVLALASKERLSREAAARKLRYHALEEMAQDIGCRCILTAHTADDSAETFLMRFIQSPDWWEWTSIPGKRGNVLRPLITVRREEVRLYAHDRALSWCDDSSNQDPRFLRNYVRLRAMPSLAEQGGGVDVLALADAGTRIRKLVEGMLQEADRFVHNEAQSGQPGKKVLAIADIFSYFTVLPWAPLERAAAQLVGNADLRWPAWRRRQVAAFIAGRAPKGALSVGGDIFLLRNGSRLAMARSLPQKACCSVRGPGSFTFNNSGELRVSIQPNGALLDQGDRIRVRAGLAARHLQLRTWQPGDKLDIFRRGHRRVSGLLSELRADPVSRMGALVLCDEEGPFWLVGHWSDQRVRPLRADKLVLELEWKPTAPAS